MIQINQTKKKELVMQKKKRFLIQVHLLRKKTDYSTKITEIENKIPSISGLATNSALTTVESKTPNISNLVKKTDYNTKLNENEKKIIDHNHDKYITTPEFNKLTTENFKARLK